MKYQIKPAITLLVAFFVMVACGDVNVDNYFPMPANRTATPMIQSVDRVDNTLVVKWTPTEGAAKYRLYFCASAGCTPQANDGVLESRGESATLAGIQDFTDYYFVATSFNDRGLESEASLEFKYTAPQAPVKGDISGMTELGPGEFIVVPYAPTISFMAAGLDSSVLREWHILDFHEGNPEISSAHFMIYGCDIRMIKQTYKPVLQEQHVGDNFCFDPSIAYRWEVQVSHTSFNIKIFEGKDLRVEIGQPWRQPFGSIDLVRIGAGMFGGTHTAPGPIWIKML